jgi:hypothetical protein
LTPQAARRVGREAAERAFEKAAQALREDWGVTWSGKQLQRWGERIGAAVQAEREREVLEAEGGRYPDGVQNGPELLVLGVDGGRVQMRDREEETGSRWREDKVVTLTSYLPGDGAEREPEKLVTTMAATMGDTLACGRLARVEAERRGWTKAAQVVVVADGGNWIDPLLVREFGAGVPRVVDWCHAEEHLHECGRAVHGPEEGQAKACSEPLVEELWNGRVEVVLARLREAAEKLGAPQAEDGQEHPRRILARNVNYFEVHGKHMNYPEYRRKGWPIGSGNTEAGVKQFNKRVKGTEQFWREKGVEAILALRALWISQDNRWERYWSSRPAYQKKPA